MLCLVEVVVEIGCIMFGRGGCRNWFVLCLVEVVVEIGCIMFGRDGCRNWVNYVW